MAQVKINVSDNRIRVQAPFELKDDLKGIAGARWQPKSEASPGAWTYPATIASAASIFSLVTAQTRGAEIKIDETFHRLVEVAQRADAAKNKKWAEELEEVLSKTKSWLHQRQAFHSVEPLPAALLWMGMGTGKTKVACDLIVNRGHKRVLVICPKKVIKTWQEENEVHSAKDVQVVMLREGTVEQKTLHAQMALALAEQANMPVVIVINYEAAYREPFGPTYEIEEYVDRSGETRTRQVMKDKGFALTAGFDLVIMDEGHKIKKPGGRISKFCAHFPNHIPNRLELTGTPFAHGPLDIYAQFRALDPGIFGTSFVKFRERYAIMGGFQNREVVEYINMDEFDAKVASITYQVGAEVLDLPTVVHQRMYCQLPADAQKIYNQMDAAMVASIGEDVEVVADNILVKMLRCQQVTSGYIEEKESGLFKHLHNAKRELLSDTLEDLKVNDLPVVVFCKFTPDLNAVREVSKELGLTCGEVSGRADDLEAFKAGSFDVLAVQIQAGGAGVNLTRSHVAIYYSVGYSLLDFEQSLKRLDRPGQTKSVLNIHFITENTIDEDVYAALANKEDVVRAVKARIRERQQRREEAA